jgi:DNA repair protein RadD
MNAALFPPAVTEPRTLRLYQETAIEMLRESLRTGHRRPILQLPTGAGKTRIAAEIILGSLSNERRAIFVVPRLSLIEQSVAAFQRAGVWNIGVIQGRHFRTNPGAPTQVASAQTLARRVIPPADIVLIDECHMRQKSITAWIASPEWRAVPFIGLSATPWSLGLGRIYDDLLMPVSIQELIDEGYLSPFRVFAPPAPDLTGVRTVAGEFHEADLSDACNTKEIVADVVTTWLEKGENRATLCYGVDRKHAQHLQERFIEAGVRAEYIDCDVELFEREEIFDRFRAGVTRVICNVATLDTGIDLDVRCISDARPTKSRIRFVQTVGRGLRPAEGKDHLIVLDHAGNHQRLGLVTDIGCCELDKGDAGRSYDKDGRVAVPTIKLCPECNCVLPPRARECPGCGFKIYAATEVLERDGELVELGSRLSGSISDRHSQECAKKDLWHGALVKIAKQKGYARGWAAHKFREKFGHWPTLNYPPEREPTLEILNWVRSRNIAYAKAQQYG